MADFDLALAMTADGSQAVSEVDRVVGALDRTAAAERNASTAATALESTTGRATAAAGAHAAAQGQAGQATAAAATASQRLVVAQSNLSAAEARATAATEALAVAQTKAAAAVGQDAAAQEAASARIAGAQARVAAAAAGVVRAQAGLNAAQGSGVDATNRNAFAMRNAGQQFGDFATQVSLGGGFARAFASQAGQMGYALSEFQSGPLASVGKFLVGPWGIALTVASVALAPFIEKLFEAGKAAEESKQKLDAAATAADSYGTAQSLLGKVIDLTTGKLKTQNAVLIQTIKLQAQASLADAQKRIDDLNEKAGIKLPGATSAISGSAGVGGVVTGDIDRAVQAAQAVDKQQASLSRVVASLTNLVNRDATKDPVNYAATVGRGIDAAIARVDALSKGGKVAGRSLQDVKLQILGIGTAANDKAAALESLTALATGVIADPLKPYETAKKPKKPKKPASTAARDEFGRDAEDRIANLVGQFGTDTANAALEKTNKQIRAIDDLIDDLGRKKPPNFQELIASAERAKVVVREGIANELAKAFEKPKTLADQAAAAFRQLDAIEADLRKNQPAGFEDVIASAERAKGAIREGLLRPYNDYITAQGESLAVLRLQVQGRTDEAEALRQIQALEKGNVPLSAARKDAVLATVQAMRAEQRQIDINREHVALYTTALGQIKGVVEDATQAFVRGDLGQLIKSPGKILDAFQSLQGQVLFNKLFGDAFRQLQDQISGTSVVEDASARMADAVDQVTTQTGQTTAALNDLAGASRAAAGAVGAVPGAGGYDPGAEVRKAADAAFADQAAELPGGRPVVDGDTGTSVITGKRPNTVTRDPTALFSQAIGTVATKITGLFTNPENAKSIGQSIGSYAGKGLQGAAVGTATAGIAKSLGIKLNQTGAQLGGAVGSFIPIPGGSVIGSVLGGLVGNLFGKTKKASAGVSIDAGGYVNAGTATGTKSLQGTASGLAGSVAQGISSIAQQLGAQLGGSTNVQIGQYKDQLRVSTNGTPIGGKGSSGAVTFKSEAEAINYALRDAINDGVFTGLSEAVQRALRGNSNVDQAVAEALKVQEVEKLIGGIGGELKAEFDAQAKNAAERLRIAKAYGLDVVAVEKVNAEERAKLVDAALKQSTQSLQDLLKDMASGDLFEGTAADKRKAILDQIDQTKADVASGKEGATDTLADLYRNLLSTSKDGYGTAGGEYASDTKLVSSGAAAVIKSEQDRINQAAGIQAATTTAVEKVATLTNETNDLLAVTNSSLVNLPAAIAAQIGDAVTFGGEYGRAYDPTARQSKIAV